MWLNEAQHYLGPDPLGERVAAGLRELLHDPLRAPVLVLGTLWPGHWNTLTSGDRHSGARDLLSGHKIDVPDAFTPADLAALAAEAAEAADPRLAQAAQHADHAQVTQYLAGVPDLMDRYNAARGVTLALIHAAMDARRLGAGLHVPLDWLADAAPGYLTDTEYHALALDGEWLSQALAYVTTPCNGIPGILTPVNTSSPRNQRKSRRPAASSTPADRPAPGRQGRQGPHYLLADYLDQHGRYHRAEIIPPVDFWSAAAHHAHPADMTALGDAAWARGLYRDATQLHKHATIHGNLDAARTLVNRLHGLHPTDHNPAQWAAANVTLDNLGAVLRLLDGLREAGADEQATDLAERAAAHAILDNPFSVDSLLWVLQKAGKDEQATALTQRAAAHLPLDNPGDVADRLKRLREAGADEQAAPLAEGAAAHLTLDDPYDVAGLLRELREAGADEQATALAERAAAHIFLDDPCDVAELLRGLREAGADEQVSVLLARNPAAHVTLDHPGGAVDGLWGELREAGADEQATALVERLPAAGHFELFIALAGNRKEFRLGCEPDGSAAPSWTWDDID
ncbi:hypothetical protein [Streptomyces virginiae]|uniref:hypothetical protein n=1 Tax=Streptomyces virginiae TaxID=1961 RepID=UPI00324DA604